jgi:hypothetical protein
MKKLIASSLMLPAFTFSIVFFTACSKSDSPSPVPPDACAGKTISITTTPEATIHCSNDGKIDITVTGSTGFTYKLNSTGTYQAASKFTDLAEGSYTVFVKDAAGCEKSVAVTVGSGGTEGAQFTTMKALVAAKCQDCHNNALANGGMNFQNECNIVKNKARIKIRAVDEGTMPQNGPLSQSDKDIISNWITGGGTFTN